jgi:hypothetical protein
MRGRPLMATTLAKKTVDMVTAAAAAAFAPLLDRALAQAAAPLAERVEALTAEVAGMRALMAAPVSAEPPVMPALPPVTVPEPVPTPLPASPVSACIVTVTSPAGAAWRWNATADAKQDSLGLRAMAEVPAENAGCTSLRLVVDLGTGWAIVVPRNDIANRAGGGVARYSLQVHLDGALVLDERDITTTQYRGTRPFRLGKLPAWPLPSTDSLIQRGLVARYKQGPVANDKPSGYVKAMAAADWHARDSSRGIQRYMPGTGGRDDIGPATAAQAVYLQARDPQVLAYVIGQAETATTIPWHLWDAKAGSWLSVENWPRLWTDGRGGEPGKGTLLQGMDGDGWEVESAHQPDLSYVAYLLIGERWILDNLQAQAAWNIVYQWKDTRGDSDMVVVNRNQVRGAAWALRQIDEAAHVSPEGSAEKAYFTKASRANWSWILSQLPAWTKEQGEAHGTLRGVYGVSGGLSVWQQDYFASTALAAARRGNEDAKTYLRWARNFLVGRFTHLGHDAVAYLLADTDPKTGLDYGTWDRIKVATAANGWSNGNGWSKSQGDYAQWAIFTLRGLADVLGDAEAAKWADWLVKEKAPFVSDADMARDPLLRV